MVAGDEVRCRYQVADVLPCRPDEDEDCQPRVKRRKSSMSPLRAANTDDQPRRAATAPSAPAQPACGGLSGMSHDEDRQESLAAAEPLPGQASLVRQPSNLDRPALTWAEQPAALSRMNSEPVERSDAAAWSRDLRSHAGAVCSEGGKAHGTQDESQEAARDGFAEQQEPFQAVIGALQSAVSLDARTAPTEPAAQAAPPTQPVIVQLSTSGRGDSHTAEEKAPPRRSATARPAPRPPVASKQPVRTIPLRSSQRSAMGVRVAVPARKYLVSGGHATESRSGGTADASRAGQQQAQATKHADQLRRGRQALPPAAGKGGGRRVSGRHAETGPHCSAAAETSPVRRVRATPSNAASTCVEHLPIQPSHRI